jgi:DNA-binding NarL/FixJ family response regulator
VLIVEDDPAFRTRFHSVLQADPLLDVLPAVGSLAAGLAALQQGPVELLVVDLGLPDGNGTELIRAAAQWQPACVAMVVTVFGDEEHVVRAIEAGASGYLLKDAGDDDMRAALHDLLAGGSPISPMVARLVLARMRAPRAPDPATDDTALGDREAEILTLVAKGFSFAEICGLLSITVNTVKTHVNRAYRKLGVHSRSQAVHEATRRGLIAM